MLTQTDFNGHLTRYVYDDSAAGGGRLLEERRYVSTAAYQSDPAHPAERTLGRQTTVAEYVSTTNTASNPLPRHKDHKDHNRKNYSFLCDPCSLPSCA